MQVIKFLVIFLIPLILNFAHASDPCECKFNNNNYSAYGTRAACTAITRGGQTCEVRFGATTFEKNIVIEVIPELTDYDSFRNKAFDITFTYLQALRDNNTQALNDETFLLEAIPYFIRSAYLSTTEPLIPISDLKVLDQKIVAYLTKNISTVQKIFSNQQKPTEEDFQGTIFKINRGYIEVESGELRIVNVLFPEIK